MSRNLLITLALAPAIGLAQDVTTMIQPHNPPVRIPATGGNFDYMIDATNNGSSPLEFDIWTVYRMPDNSLQGPVYGPVQMCLPVTWAASSGRLTQYVPESMPAGDYACVVRAGVYPDTVWAQDSFAFTKRSLVGGWFPQVSGTSNSLFDVFFSDPVNGWATGFDIFHTSDGGQNWYVQPDPSASHYYGVYFVDSLIGWTVGDGLGKVLHTSNGGDTWVIQQTGYSGGYYFRGVYFADANRGWAVGGFPQGISPPKRVIINTVNGGTTWNTQLWQSQYVPFLGVHFSDENNGWVIGAGGVVFHTTNGGANWFEQEPGVNTELHGVHFVDSLTGWVTGRDGTILHTTDGGATWEQQTSGTSNYLADVYFVDRDTGWTVGGGNEQAVILHTTDGGENWDAQDPGTTNLLWAVDLVNSELGWAVGWAGTIVHTQTGGSVGLSESPAETRQPLDLSLTHGAPNPFTRTTSLSFFLPRSSHASARVYDATGRQVAVLLSENLNAGRHRVEFKAGELPSGVYAVKLEALCLIATEEMVLAR